MSLPLGDVIDERKVPHMIHGARQFLLWWDDIMAEGLQYIEQQMDSLSHISSLLVDAGCGAMGRQLRLAKEEIGHAHPTQWIGRITDQAILAKSLLQSRKKQKVAQLDILIRAGASIRRSVWNQIPTQQGQFIVLHIENQIIEQLHERKVYFQSCTSGKLIVLIDYLFRSDSFATSWELGSTHDLQVQFYPSIFPLRVKLINGRLKKCSYEEKGIPSFSKLQLYLTNVINRHPWIRQYPLVLQEVEIHRDTKGHFFLTDKAATCGFTIDEQAAARLLFGTHGTPFSCFAIWKQGQLGICSIIVQHQIMPLLHTIWTH